MRSPETEHRILSVAALVSLLALALGPSVALACTCIGRLSAREEFAAAGAVFRGEVRSIARAPSSFVLHVQFAHVTRWKGPAQPELEVVTYAYSDACGFAFEEGQEYLVYTEPKEQSDGSDRPLSVESCSRTVRIEDAAEDLAFLERYEPLLGHMQQPRGRPGAATCAAPGQSALALPMLWLTGAWLLGRRRREG
jgi:hypothetical protein